MMAEGSLNCLALHKKGLYAAGQDGVLRKIDVSQDKVRVVDSYAVGTPITSLSFNTLYSKLAIGSDLVSKDCIILSRLRYVCWVITLVFVGVQNLWFSL